MQRTCICTDNPEGPPALQGWIFHPRAHKNLRNKISLVVTVCLSWNVWPTFFKFVVCNPCQPYPSLTILVPSNEWYTLHATFFEQQTLQLLFNKCWTVYHVILNDAICRSTCWKLLNENRTWFYIFRSTSCRLSVEGFSQSFSLQQVVTTYKSWMDVEPCIIRFMGYYYRISGVFPSPPKVYFSGLPQFKSNLYTK